MKLLHQMFHLFSKEVLEHALNQYTGTVFFVSHDRYFINQTATRILELNHEHLDEYKGNYDYYLQKKEEAKLRGSSVAERKTQVKEETQVKMDWKQQKEEKARLRKQANRIKQLEKEIEKLEEQSAKLDEEIALPEHVSNSGKLIELTTEKSKIDETLMLLYDEWETLSEASV